MRPSNISPNKIGNKEISYTDLLAKLKQEIEKKNLTLKDIETLTGISRVSITNVLNGSSNNPTIKTLITIAKAIHYEIKFSLRKGQQKG